MPERLEISTQLTVRASQDVHITGAPSQASDLPSVWGPGGFTVDERGALTLTRLEVPGAIQVLPVDPGGCTAFGSHSNRNMLTPPGSGRSRSTAAARSS